MTERLPIQCKNLSRSWTVLGHVHQALRDVDLAVEPGAYLSIEGGSGAGKSSLLRILGGLDRAYQGDVRLFGHALNTMSDAAVARLRNEKISFIFQSFQLLPHLNVAENILLPFSWRRPRKNEAQARSALMSLLEQLEIGDKAGHFPEALSGGQQQRVAIARALITRPQLLLCDEMTGSLDDATAHRVMTLVEDYREQSGCTLLMVSHDPRIIARAETHLRLENGQLREVGAPLGTDIGAAS